MSPPDAKLLLQFALGYFAVLAAPGPNMLTIGAMAALRGLRGVLPFCLGVAAGATALAVGLQVALAAMAGLPGLEAAGRLAGAGLLGWIALRLLRVPPPLAEVTPDGVARARPQAEDLAAVGAGFCTAVTNPITAAYFGAQFLGPLAAPAAQRAALPLVTVQALAVGLTVAMLFAQPLVRRAAWRHRRVVSAASALALLMLAAGMLGPLLRGHAA
jgi:threonine/homoserine/homoserine lactone efflux protein